MTSRRTTTRREGSTCGRRSAGFPACVVMRFYDDMRVADIAEALGLSEGAVKRYLSDGIHHLNTALGTGEDPDAPDAPTADVVASGRRAGR